MIENIFGCFVSVTLPSPSEKQETIDLAKSQGDLFRSYIYGEKGLSKIVKMLDFKNYGKDFKLILFQFYVNPLPIEENSIRGIEAYRKKEKSIGVPIIVNDDNFFSKSEDGRYNFLKESLLNKMDLVAEVVIERHLDTDIEKLTRDLNNVLNTFNGK